MYAILRQATVLHKRQCLHNANRLRFRGPLLIHLNFSTCHSNLPWHLYFLLPFILFGAEQEPIVPLFEDNYTARTSLSLLFRDVTRELAQVLIKSTTIRFVILEYNYTRLQCWRSVNLTGNIREKNRYFMNVLQSSHGVFYSVPHLIKTCEWESPVQWNW